MGLYVKWSDPHGSKKMGMGILLSHKQEQNLAICSNVDGLGGHYAKWSKSEKDKYCMILLMCGIHKIQQTGEQKKKQIYRYREQTSGYQWGGVT